MVISNLNTDRVLDLVRLIETYVEELRPFAEMSKAAFLSDKKNPPFVESYLRRGLEAVFDIGRHILPKVHGFRGIEYKTIAEELGNKGIVSKALAETIYETAGYRNRMVHFYREVSNEELYAIVKNNLDDFERFNREITAFIRAYEARK